METKLLIVALNAMILNAQEVSRAGKSLKKVIVISAPGLLYPEVNFNSAVNPAEDPIYLG